MDLRTRPLSGRGVAPARFRVPAGFAPAATIGSSLPRPAEFGQLVVVCGDVMTMPGLLKEPSAAKIDLDDEGKVVGLLQGRMQSIGGPGSPGGRLSPGLQKPY
jgi:Formate--tetrahydrofolate ligase